MRFNKLKKTYLPVMLMLSGAYSCMVGCSDNWDDHYEQGMVSGSKSLMTLLDENDQLSLFAQMVRKSGYEQLLSSSQTLTVWAPVNDGLRDIDMNNDLMVKQTVENHIGRFSHPLSTASDETRVRMLNGKRLLFSNSADAYKLADAQLNQGSVLANNGLLYELGTHVVYRPNLYEYIASRPDCSMLYDFLNEYQEHYFDVDQSIELDVDANGRPVYDSVFVDRNILLQDKLLGLGDIANEDSVYTMLIPDNAAWQAAYTLMHPAFKVMDNELTDEQLDSVADIRTKLAIVNDLIVRGQVNPLAVDSVITTGKSVMKNLSELYGAAQQTEMSNGVAYVCNRLNYDNTQTWSKAINVEAELSDNYQFQLSSTSVFPRIVAADNPVQGISGNSYLEVTPVRTTAAPAVEFYLPDVLGGKDEGVTYNIHVVMVPALVEGEDMSSDSTKVQFTLYHNNGSKHEQLARSAEFETSGTRMVRLEAFKDFAFPVSDRDDMLNMIANNYSEAVLDRFTLSATTTIKSSNKNYTRNFRIDRIILEPIKKEY
ncbi:MAG: fasciclin domain-containing protein [Clostridium sp.]|nr:fasciclin domain-containing protein [Clostridium sp.]